MKKKIRNLSFLLGVLASIAFLAIGTFALILHRSEPITKKGINRVEWLPNTASDITYTVTEGFGWYRIAEFTIKKSEFENWAKEMGWYLENKERVSVHFRSIFNEPPLIEKYGTGMDFVENSLFFEDRKPNGGGITVVYDLASNRCYFSQSHR